MNRVDKTIERADKKCTSHGARLTAKRKLVLSGLLKSERAMSAYELVDYCKEEFDQVIPAMSVYRILEFLAHEQLAHKVNFLNKYIACCQIDCDHAHGRAQLLVCGKCERVKEISLGESTENKLNLDIRKAGFQLESCLLYTSPSPRDS